MVKANTGYKLFETFVGAGGSHIGFMKENFVSVYVNDFVDECLKTLSYNNPNLALEGTFLDNTSIIEIDPRALRRELGCEKGEIDVLFGGVVCKGFSLAGEKSPNDERNYFYHKQLELVGEFEPKISIIENVVGILSAKVLSRTVPMEVKDTVDDLWKQLENFKGKKAQLRKVGQLTPEVLEEGNELRKKKDSILKMLEKEGYLVSVMEDIFDIYNTLGYDVEYKVLNSAWYGAATKRERVIIVATKRELNLEFEFPKPTHMDSSLMKKEFPVEYLELKNPVTVNDALSTIDYSNKEDEDNLPMNHAPKTIGRFKYIPEGDSIANHIEELPSDLKISKFYSRGSTMRLAGNKPSPTLVPGHSNFPVHPKEHRSITVREAAAITGFPNDYKFFGTHSKRCEQVGNAVPPKLAQAIAKECNKTLNRYYSK
ncbi:DNA cytosine methyltransferase [Streptococcus dysgalactiae]|uniref:DNA cytosine methyltransferase n=1 Tax=Streptococcus dysgalactiae TaxID=1334 RepID=UPI0010CAB24D|nr:DNA cytosine methyltransferase [Streptococcus dysgalactiae]VTS36552.1 putative cytosine-specific methyltransferase [Streptococcus dysgalactiae subsp. equisimilis]